MTTDKSGRTSVGILLWRSRDRRLEVLLAHPGGPFWVKKDIGHWTIPKGEMEPGEELLAVARREFAEETGHEAPDHPLIDLGQITQIAGAGAGGGPSAAEPVTGNLPMNPSSLLTSDDRPQRRERQQDHIWSDDEIEALIEYAE